MELVKQREDWRYVIITDGGQYVTMNGQIDILQWCVGIWDSVMSLEVCWYTIILKDEILCQLE